VQGMDCAQEVSLLRAALSRVTGVRDLKFDVVQGWMEVEYGVGTVEPAGLERAVAGLGMRAEVWRAEVVEASWDWRRGLAWVSGLAVLAGAGVQVAGGESWVEALLAHGHEGHGGHVMPAAAVVSYAVAVAAGAAPVVKKAWGALRARQADMNLLVAVSLAGAGVLGEWAEAGTLAFLFALAGRLEHWSMNRARAAIAKLLEVTPAEAVVVHRGGHEGHGHGLGQHSGAADGHGVRQAEEGAGGRRGRRGARARGRRRGA